ncbi:MAG: glycosyltransferase family 4 protein [Prolixibacteraceae bacterium]|nr:glycosyltransferase family 4 protein [Prolixibacteraceae bacterium]MBN2773200.1 glycosyltransferase family 4 protein [Prolixibacteraceae bacterium]
MKVLYISQPYFFDMDLSLVQSLSKKVDLYYLFDLQIYALNSPALTIENLPESAGIFQASLINEFNDFSDFLQLDKTAVICRTSKKTYAISNIKLQNQITDLVKNLDPDIIHCNNFLTFHFLKLLLQNRKPIIQTIHDPFPHSGENSYRDFLLRKLNYSFIKKKILLNFTQREEFIRSNNFNKSDIYSSSLGPYTYLSKYAKPEQQKTGTNNILFFGRISKYKGIDYLIQAVKKLQEDIPDIKLTIAGKGEFWFDVTDLEDSENFEIINQFISTEKLVELLQANELVVCPYTDATQSGVIMTAYAFCKPVIATNVGGLAEMVENNVTGILVGARNVKQLSEAIKKLLTDRTKLNTLKENIKKQYFEGSHSWDARAEELIKIYSNVIFK